MLSAPPASVRYDRIRRLAHHPATARGLLVCCAGSAWGMAALSDQPAHRYWGLVAGLGYLLVAVLPHARRASAPWLAGLAGGVIPLVLLVLARGDGTGPTPFAQPEVWVVEDAAGRWLESRSPYPAGPPTGPDDFFPYLPGMALFGLPRALAGAAPLTDARLWFALTAVAGVALAYRAGARSRTAGWLMAGNPVVGLTLATGGHDLALAGLLLAGLVTAGSAAGWSAPIAGGLFGLAAAVKPTAWPVVAVAGLLLVRRRSAGRALLAGLPPLVVLLAVGLATPRLLIDNVVLFPSGTAGIPTPAASPFPGTLAASLLSGGRMIAITALVAAAVIACYLLWRRPPQTVAQAALFAAASLTAATLLAPASRVGWLVVPLLLAALSCPQATSRTPVAIQGSNDGSHPNNSSRRSSWSLRPAGQPSWRGNLSG